MLPLKGFIEFFNFYDDSDEKLPATPTDKLVNGHKKVEKILDGINDSLARHFSDNASDAANFKVCASRAKNIFMYMKDAAYPLPPPKEISLTHPVIVARKFAAIYLQNSFDSFNPVNNSKNSPLSGLLAVLRTPPRT